MIRRFRDPLMAEYLGDLHKSFRDGRVSRREFTRWAAMLGVSLPVIGQLTAPLSGAAQSATDETPVTGGTLRVSSFVPTALDPQSLADLGGAAAVHLVCDQLVRIGADLIARPHLAESWEASDNATRWTFKLREGVTFNNGQPFDVDDVIWTFNFLLDPGTASAARAAVPYLQPEGIVRIDDYTVEFNLDRPVAVFPYDISNYQFVMLPRDWPGDFVNNPIGTGAFVLDEFVVEEYAVYSRNPTHWNAPLPYVDGVRLTFFADGQAEANALLGNQIDVSLFPGGSAVNTLRGDSSVAILSSSSAAHNQMHFRADQEPFTDVRVRQAMKYCIDRHALLEFVYNGVGDLGNDHLFAPVFPEAVDNGLRPQDHEMAKQLLSDAGHPDGIDIEFYGSTDSAGSPDPLMIAFQQMAEPAGIRVTLRPEPIGQYYEHWTEVTVGTVGWLGRPTINSMLNLSFRGGAAWNAGHWANDEFDALLDQLDATVELEVRRELAAGMADLMTDDGAVIIFGFPPIYRATRENVRGVEASPISHSHLDGAWLATS